MKANSNVIVRPRTAGLLLGSLGVLGFSLSLPMTKVALTGLDPWFIAFGRSVGAGALALAYLVVTRARLPTGGQLRRLGVVAIGVVVGFPLFTSIGLTMQTSAHGAVVVTLLPAATAVLAVLRAGERPSPRFWLASAGGLVSVLAFVIISGAVRGGVSTADLFFLAAVGFCALGYAEGGMLARDLGGAQTICWALIVALPVTVPVTTIVALHAAAGPNHFPTEVTTTAWLSFAYLTTVSMFLGFIAWYAGLARGGVARVGQVQLAQPAVTIAWSALLLSEPIGALTIISALAVLASVFATQRAR
jgi:drug/metabolite transporter (DMT)-like permease